MWEHRLVWAGSRPAWWDETWSAGVEVLARQQRAPEARPDTYLVLLDRPDIGLKLRGGDDEQFDAKMLHARTGGWELWEKLAYFRWDALEAARFAVSVRAAAAPPRVGATPTAGAKDVLRAAGLGSVEVRVEKTRIQASASDLLAPVAPPAASTACLAELVAIRLADRRDPLFSLCIETMDPVHSAAEIVERGGALSCGYPELLVRHVRGTL